MRFACYPLVLLSICVCALASLDAAEHSAEMHVIAACDETHYRHSEGSAIELPDGRILLVWSRFNGHKNRCGTLGDNGPATLVLAESTDGGPSWSEPRELPVGKATVNIMQAAFVPVKNRLMLAFSVRMTEGRTSVKHAIESKDDGRTWSERRPLFPAGGANDRAVRLSTGRILMPSHRRSEKRIGKDNEIDVLVARSDDEGATWQLSAPIDHQQHPMESKDRDPNSLKLNEPTVAECPDGSLLMLARSSVGVLYQSRSKDKGVTWTTLVPTTIPAFAAPPYMRRLYDGRLALLWNPIAGKDGTAKAKLAIRHNTPVPYGKREELVLATSRDGGRTWSKPEVIAQDRKRNGFCYPWMVEKKDGSLLVFCSRTPYTIYPCDLVQLPPVSP